MKPDRSRPFLPVTLFFLAFAGNPATADICTGTAEARTATAKDIAAFAGSKHKDVLTLAGYSGAGYENPAAMLEQAGRILDRHDPRRTLVNIGATAEGIGAVYSLAKQKGFETMGIVSALARSEKVHLSDCVDRVFFIKDPTWGGVQPGTGRLSPTSAAIVANSSALAGIGGGEVARDELLAAKAAGKPVEFFPADMNHGLAIAKAARKGQPAPTDFKGAADAALR